MAQVSVSPSTVVDGGLPASADLLPYADQALFLGLRAAGLEAVVQVFWVYRHRLDPAGVDRFRRNLQKGLLARLIEPSPLPFGRHRWVSAPQSPSGPDTTGGARDPGEFYDWADEQIGLPLDPQRGPGWRLGLQAFTDGTTAVSLVVSHCIADGGALVIAICEAVAGVERELGYPPPQSRTRRRALAGDLRQALRDAPDALRALGGAARMTFRRRAELLRPAPPVPAIAVARQPVVVPSATAFVGADVWDALAQARGGNGFSLFAGVAAMLAERLGRTRKSDGTATLIVPVSHRHHPADTRGNVVSLASVRVDPAGIADDLGAARAALRAGLAEVRDRPDEMAELSPLVPFLPARAAGRIADAAFGFSADLPVSVSNMGELPTEITRVDGTPADLFWFRGMDRNVTQAAMARRRGILTVMSGRVGGDVVVTVISHQPGGANTRRGLVDLLASVLSEFGLAVEIR